MEDAAFAAIDCIRIVADRYRSRPKLRIAAPVQLVDLVAYPASLKR